MQVQRHNAAVKGRMTFDLNGERTPIEKETTDALEEVAFDVSTIDQYIGRMLTFLVS